LVSGGCCRSAVDNLSNASHASGLLNALNRFTFDISKALNSFSFVIDPELSPAGITFAPELSNQSHKIKGRGLFVVSFPRAAQ